MLSLPPPPSESGYYSTIGNPCFMGEMVSPHPLVLAELAAVELLLRQLKGVRANFFKIPLLLDFGM